MPGRNKPRFYAVTRGKYGVSGIFTNWNDRSPFVTGVKRVIYQSYTSLNQAKTVLQQGGYEPKVYKDGSWVSFKQFEEESDTYPSNDDYSACSISDEENPEQLTYVVKSTSGDFDPLQENEESHDPEVTTLKSPLDENKTAEGSHAADGLLDDNCTVCGETKHQFMLQCEVAKYLKNKSKKYMSSSYCKNDTKLASLTNEVSSKPGNVGNMSYSNDITKITSLIKCELDEFKKTTIRSMETKFTDALEKVNTSVVIVEMEILKRKVSKVMDNQNNLSSVLQAKRDAPTDYEKKTIKSLEKDNSSLHSSLKAKTGSLEDTELKVNSLKEENAE